MASNTPEPISTVLFSYSKSLPDTHEKSIKAFHSSFPNVELKDGAVIDDLLKLIDEKKPAVLIYHISGSEELQEIINFLPKIRSSTKDRTAIVAVFVKMTSKKLEDALHRSGSIEVLPYDLPQKALFHKLKRYISNLADPIKVEAEHASPGMKLKSLAIGPSSENQKPSEEVDSLIESIQENKQKLLSLDPEISLTDPLTSRFDFWLLRKISYIKRYKGQWMIELIGPSPVAGKWTLTRKFEDFFEPDQTVWEWTKREQSEAQSTIFETAPSSWVFSGKKPEYNWSVNRWAFISDSPALHIINDGLISETRLVENDDGILEIAQNSEIAKRWFHKIKDTYNKDHYKDSEKPTDSIPWSDNINSNDIPPAAWKTHDLTKPEGMEWNDSGNFNVAEEIQKEDKEFEFDSDLNIPLGANAMKDCGIHASLHGEEVELMSYSENQPIILIGSHADVSLKDQLDIDINSENLEQELSFTLKGFVTQIETDELNRKLITVMLQPESHKKIALIRESIERRQQEIFAFFKRTKGIG